MLQTGNHGMLFKELHDFAFNIIKGILQNRAGVNKIAVMQQIARNAQSANHFAGGGVKMLVVIIHKPVDSFIHYHVHTSVVQRSNTGEHNGGAVGLRSTAL